MKPRTMAAIQAPLPRSSSQASARESQPEKPVEAVGYGYYHADRATIKEIMRPSATLNGILAGAAR